MTRLKPTTRFGLRLQTATHPRRSQQRMLPRAGRRLALVALIAAVGLGSSSTANAASPTPVTIDRAALGTGGGPFCDAMRSNVSDSLSANLAQAISTGDTAKLKAYYEKNGALIPRLIALAPSPIAGDTKLAMQVSLRMAKALMNANYDYRKLDPKAMAAASSISPSETAASAKLNAYMAETCHIDIAKLFGISVPAPSGRATSPTKGSASGGTLDPCALLTQAEVDTAVGQPLKPGKRVATLLDCIWTTSDGAAGVDVTVSGWTQIKVAANGNGGKPVPITGIGDEALNRDGTLYVRKGSQGFLLSINGPHIDSKADHGLAQAKVLAVAVLGRMQ